MAQEYVRIGTGKEEVFSVPDSRNMYWQLQDAGGIPLRWLPHYGRKVSRGLLSPPIEQGRRYVLVLGSHQDK